MKKCPFCAEDIQDNAIKCKHCGEMLTKENVSHIEEKSMDYKEVKKGIKRAEFEKIQYNILAFFGFLVSVLIGWFTGSWLVGIIVFFVLGFFVSGWYFEIGKKK